MKILKIYRLYIDIKGQSRACLGVAGGAVLFVFAAASVGSIPDNPEPVYTSLGLTLPRAKRVLSFGVRTDDCV